MKKLSRTHTGSTSGGALLHQTIVKRPPRVVAAHGVFLYDSTGRNYLDGSGGAMTVSIGHGVQEVLVAMRAQAEQACFTYRTHFTSSSAEELADSLAQLAPGDLDHVLFANSGSEATEMAMRAAVQYWRERGKPHKTHVLGRSTSYHGMTLGALSMSGHGPRRVDYGDLLHAFNVGPSPECWDGSNVATNAGVEAPDTWRRVIESHGNDKVAALIVEPIVGAAGGVLVPPHGHLRELRKICDELDVLLIADEVITGFGRTGTWFACEHDAVVPDMIAVGKGMTSGYTPMSALLVRSHIAEVMRAGSGSAPFGHTFSGNPLSAATCLAVLRYLQDRKVLDNARVRSTQLGAGLTTLARQHKCMKNVRGRGMLWGFDLHDPITGPSPDPSLQPTAAFIDDCFEAGLIVYPAGIAPRSAAIVAPPLTITQEETSELLTRLDEGLNRFAARFDG